MADEEGQGAEGYGAPQDRAEIAVAARAVDAAEQAGREIGREIRRERRKGLAEGIRSDPG